MSKNTEKSTDWFGNERVDRGEKRRRVSKLFSEVADNYDQMNDLMSFGMHRLWKRFMIRLADIRSHHQVLEVAAGSSDLARLIVSGMDEPPGMLITDINPDMLKRGRARLMDMGQVLPYALMDGESLPLATGSVDRILLSFGLRNIANQERCLQEMHRVLKPGGLASIMEFSMDMPSSIRPTYDAYSLNWLPRLGKWVAGNEDGYRYLAESIRKQRCCKEMTALLGDTGYTRVRTNKLALGAVVLYRAWR